MSDLQTYTITAAVVVAAVAIVVQTVILFAMYLASRAMKKQITPLVAKMEPLAEQSQRVLEEVRAQVKDVTSRASEVLELSRKQLARADEFLEEATDRARAQMDRIELVLDDAAGRFQETVSLLHRGVLGPLRQLHGLTMGIRTALAVLFGERRTTVARATHDEEMFI
jgi:ABC-type phosphate transport system auxiliary subunit